MFIFFCQLKNNFHHEEITFIITTSQANEDNYLEKYIASIVRATAYYAETQIFESKDLGLSTGVCGFKTVD